MPNYDYQCEKCGKFEIWQSIKDDAMKACPTCGSKVERLISVGVGLVLKGSGFYQNDYKNTSSTSTEGKPSESTAPGCGACGSPDSCPSGNN